MTASDGTLPGYDRPPVVESYLGVQFLPLKGFSIPHFGLYLAKIRENYPDFQVQLPLVPAIEQFGVAQYSPRKVGVELVSSPEVRCWFIDKSGAMLNQVQSDRFLHNWRKVKPEDVSVHYDRIKPQFTEEWKTFCDFLNETNLGRPEITQCEMTYVNHIEIGEGWKSYGELDKVVALWSGSSSEKFLPTPESVNISARYLLPDKKGRLHIEMQPAIRQDGKEILQLNLTARGRPKSSDLENLLEWFDLGHEWIVRGFTDFTAKEMHKFWGRNK